ncbi:MAG: glycoside hydrolase family 2 protein [Armatimonadetes bacterium]|nr:glycoside hydrolase family 2 protein [Armatimonadota bacterium]
MDVARRLLHAGWEFAYAPHGTVSGPADLESLSFLPATVPGTNLTDLQAAGLVAPDTAAGYEDSFAPFKSMDFVYRTQFAGEADAARRTALLSFEGLDTVCEIYLNGKPLARTENCHVGYRFDVSGQLREGTNTLALIFRSPILEAQRRQREFGLKFPAHLNSDFMFLRKPAYSFFWDWGPELPVSGIWRPVVLTTYDRAAIDDFHVRYRIEGDRVDGTVAVTAPGGDGAEAVVRIAGGTFRAPVAAGSATVPFMVKNARLWYPNGEGEPYLYNLEVALEAAGEPLDARQHRLGFRTIEVCREPRPDAQGQRFVFRVNGKEIFARGYNWIPIDNSLPRGYYDQYRGNLDLAQAANVNMLRIWGGGYYEDDEFYRMCDERGILVWQDGAFACSMYPDTDPHFLSLVEEELAYNIKRLRNFTSLAIWCGENENHWGYEEWWVGLRDQFPHHFGATIYDQVFPSLVADLDPDRFYWNGSPYSGEPGVPANNAFHGDSHFWDLHSNCGDFSGYCHNRASFVSETGIQSLPDLRTALTIGEPEDRHIQSFVFDTRNHFESPAKNDRLIHFIGALFRVTDDFERMVVLSNLAHGEYLKYAVEHWRSLVPNCSGVLIWQLNDCWPAISWSAVDYNLVPKACHYYLARAYAADLVGFQQRYSIDYNVDTNARGHLFVASERDGRKRGEVELRVVHVEGEVLETRRFPVTLDGRGAVSLGELALDNYRERRFDCLAEFTLRWEDGGTARNIYSFSRPKHMRLPRPEIRVTQPAPDRLVVRTDRFAKGVYLFHPDKQVIFSDNYFDLMPGEERLLQLSRPASAAEVRVFTYHH